MQPFFEHSRCYRCPLPLELSSLFEGCDFFFFFFSIILFYHIWSILVLFSIIPLLCWLPDWLSFSGCVSIFYHLGSYASHSFAGTTSPSLDSLMAGAAVGSKAVLLQNEHEPSTSVLLEKVQPTSFINQQ